MKSDTFNFLDVSIIRLPNGELHTGVYVKPMDTGVYTNFKSHTPLQYMLSVVKTLVYRAIKHSATWELCHVELCRDKQVMANNLYPQHMTEDIFKNCLDNHFQTNEESDTKTVEFYYQ